MNRQAARRLKFRLRRFTSLRYRESDFGAHFHSSQGTRRTPAEIWVKR